LAHGPVTPVLAGTPSGLPLTIVHQDRREQKELKMQGTIETCDACQISSLLSLYYQALDSGDLASLESRVIADDAIWDVVQVAPIGRIADKAEGRERILAWFEQMLSGDGSEQTIRHFVSTNVVEIDPSGQAARSTSHLLAVDTVTMATRANGFVEAGYVRTPHGWRIRSYKVEERLTNEDVAAYKAAFEMD
jgi:hypothetical protein